MTEFTEGQQAINDVIAERMRQVTKEGWSAEHDDAHDRGEMAVAAACYALSSACEPIHRTLASTRSGLFLRMILPLGYFSLIWPWSPSWWKPKDSRTDLVRASALLIAEIQRRDRAAARSP